MGGFGSGRTGGTKCTDDLRALDVRKLQREGALTPGRWCTRVWTRNGDTVASVQIEATKSGVTLAYRRHQGSEWRDLHYSVRLSWTGCNYGGKRAWWLCPAVDCGRRVAVLYDGSIFACRHCHRLAYRSQRETEEDRANRRANGLRDKLGWARGIANEDGGKPEGMRWRTYMRLRSAYYVEAMRALAGISSRLGLVKSGLDNLRRGLPS
jgi:hypothetical protein